MPWAWVKEYRRTIHYSATVAARINVNPSRRSSFVRPIFSSAQQRAAERRPNLLLLLLLAMLELCASLTMLHLLTQNTFRAVCGDVCRNVRLIATTKIDVDWPRSLANTATA